MTFIDDLLKKYNVRYEDLNTQEFETLTKWMQDLNKKELTIAKVKQYVEQMRDSVEIDLSTHDNPRELDLLLKARLRNYLLLCAFLTSPEKARTALEQSIQNIKPNKGGK